MAWEKLPCCVEEVRYLDAEGLEQLFGRLADLGVTILVQIQHELVGSDPWAIMISGPAVNGDAIHLTGLASFEDCIVAGVRELRTRRADWPWLDSYLV